MLLKLPIKWIVLSARTILVFVAFYIAFFVFPFSPEIRAIHLDMWSPCKFLTSLIRKVYKNRSSSLSIAIASSRLKPSMNACKKSFVLWIAERSSVYSHSRISTVFFLVFILICNFIFWTTVWHIFSQLFLRGVIRLGGMMTERI